MEVVSWINFCFLVIKSILMFLLQRLVFQKVKKKKGNVAYTLETKVIKEHLIQYSDLFILESNILFLYYFEYL